MGARLPRYLVPTPYKCMASYVSYGLMNDLKAAALDPVL